MPSKPAENHAADRHDRPTRKLAAARGRWDADRIGELTVGFVIPFALVVYLALREGGYDEIVRSEVGIVVWWMILLGAIVAALPRRTDRRGWIALGLLTAFCAWTGLASIWSESAERSVVELARVASLLGLFAFALLTQGPGSLRRMVAAVGSAIAFVGLLSLTSRFQPGWFPANEVAEVLPTEQARLNYPLAYWNGVAELIAIGLPLLLWAASGARTIAARALATAVLPALLLTVYFTLSRGGALAAALAIVALLALHPRRLALVPPIALGATGGAILIAAASQRSDLSDALLNADAYAQGDEMTLITIAVCVLAGLAAAGLTAVARRRQLRVPTVSARAAGVGVAVVAVIAVAGFVVADGPSRASDNWTEFKQPVTPGDDAARFESASGSGRYQWWRSAVDANASAPVIGIGPGTFELWFARSESELSGPVQDAHSLYLETLGELGVVGLLLLLGFLGTVGAVALARSLRSRRRSDTAEAALVAAALAALVAFAVAAAIDFAWEMTVLAACFMLLAGVIVGPREPAGEGFRQPPLLARLGVSALALVAVAVIFVPMSGTAAVRESQAQVRAGELAAAVESAQRAADWLPFAASPHLQEGLVLELGGDLDGALDAARQATEAEPTDWRHWLLLSRVQSELGLDEEATRSYQESRSLNPRSPVFSESP